MKATLDHIGIAVKDLAEALEFYRDALGLEVEAPEEVSSQRVRAHFIPVGESAIELLEATAEDSPIAKYVASARPRHPSPHAARGRHPGRAGATEGKRRPTDRRAATGRRARIARRLHPPRQRARRARRVEAGHGSRGSRMKPRITRICTDLHGSSASGAGGRAGRRPSAQETWPRPSRCTSTR